MSETPDNPPEESTGRKRAKGAKQAPPSAPAEKAATAGDSATNFIDFSSSPSGGVPTRIGIKVEDGRRIRVARKTGEELK